MKNQDYHYRSYLTACSAVSKLSNLFSNICLPIKNSFYYDMIGEKDFHVFRIKVVCTNCKQPNGSYVVNIRKSGGYLDKKEVKLPFDPKFCDYFYVETPEAAYLIPVSLVSTSRAFTLSKFESCRISSAVEREPVKF